MSDTLNDAPDTINADEDKLYNMSMDELENLVNSEKSVEQPDEDSNDTELDEDRGGEDSEESDELEEEVDNIDTDDEDEESDTDNSESSEEDVSDDDQTEEGGTDKKKNDEPAVEIHKIKAIGTEIEFTTDELKELASKGLDYTKKMQEIAPWKKQIAMMKEHKVSQDDVNLLIDLKRGNKDAILSIMKESGIDPLDVDFEEVSYRPSDYSISDSQLALRDVVGKLSQDTEIYNRTEHIVDKDWDAASRNELLTEPALLEGLHNDVKTGMYDKVMPTALKLKALDGGTRSDLEYYLEAGRRYLQSTTQQLNQQTQTSRETQRKDVESNAQRRKVASLPKTTTGKKKDVINYLDEIPDEDYKKWLKKVESKF